MSVNKVILVGNLGRDPEIRYSQDGTAVANVSLATSDQWRDKSTGERRENTEWHRVVFFGRLAEIVGEYLKTGSTICVEGKIKTRKWQDQNGQDRYTTEIVADQMKMIGGRNDNQQGHQGNQQQRPSQQNYDGGGFEQQQRPSQPAANLMDMDDSIPF